MKLLFISSEYFPLAKAGGLADAVGSLAQALAARGHDVSVILPRYGSISPQEGADLGQPLGVPLGYREEWAAIRRLKHGDVTVYLLEHLQLFGDRAGLYGPGPASAFPDNARRFAFLARGALQLALALNLQPEVIHAHDWPAALVPAMVNLMYRPAGYFADVRVVFSIHNFGYQGIFAGRDAGDIGFTDAALSSSGLEQGNDINFMKSAVAHADLLVAVSPRYAQEIQQPRFGFGLHREIQQRAPHVTGILNGVDTDEWNPASDPYLEHHYHASKQAAKATNKALLRSRMGLAGDTDRPVIGLITRLVEQKGVNELFTPGTGAVERILTELPVEMVLLGSGHQWVEDRIRQLTGHYPNFAARIGYDNGLAHLIEAGSDLFLMPSIYEPCGLNQMYSMIYGTLPIVTRTGGLADTVDARTGFFVEDNTPEAIVAAVTQAVSCYMDDSKRFKRMRTAAMKRDFSWDRSAAAYEELYTS